MGLGPRARIEVHRLFVRGFLDLGAQDLSQKLVWRKSKLPPAEASDGRGTRRQRSQKKMAYFRRFGVKESRHSKKNSREQCYLYRSTPLMLR